MTKFLYITLWLLVLGSPNTFADDSATKCGDKSAGEYFEFSPNLQLLESTGVVYVDWYENGRLVKQRDFGASVGTSTRYNFSFSVDSSGNKTVFSQLKAIGPFYSLGDGRFLWLIIDNTGKKLLVISHAMRFENISDSDTRMTCDSLR